RPVHRHGGKAAALVCQTVARKSQSRACKEHKQADNKITLPSLPSYRVHWSLLTAARERGPRERGPLPTGLESPPSLGRCGQLLVHLCQRLILLGDLFVFLGDGGTVSDGPGFRFEHGDRGVRVTHLLVLRLLLAGSLGFLLIERREGFMIRWCLRLGNRLSHVVPILLCGD